MESTLIFAAFIQPHNDSSRACHLFGYCFAYYCPRSEVASTESLIVTSIPKYLIVIRLPYRRLVNVNCCGGKPQFQLILFPDRGTKCCDISSSLGRGTFLIREAMKILISVCLEFRLLCLNFFITRSFLIVDASKTRARLEKVGEGDILGPCVSV